LLMSAVRHGSVEIFTGRYPRSDVRFGFSVPDEIDVELDFVMDQLDNLRLNKCWR